MSVSSPGEVFAHIAATARAGRSSNDWQQQQQQQHPDRLDDEQQLPLYDGQPHKEQQQQSMSFDALLDCLQQQHMQAAHPNSSSKPSKGTKRYRAARSTPRSSTSAAAACDNSSSSSSNLQQPPHIVVLDEIDNIAKHSLPGMVQLFKLPYTPGVSVMVVGIANSIDLTERTLPELRLQLVTPRLITFSAYTAQQLAAILERVLDQLPSR
jgi:Cdc6-like AAA superfamily ATPase